MNFTYLVYNYQLVGEGDYEDASKVFKEISNVDLLNINNICYNYFYSEEFINPQFKVLYRLVDCVNDVVLLVDKSSKFMKFEEIVKIIYHIKIKLIHPLIKSLNEEGKFTGSNDLSLMMREQHISKNTSFFEERDYNFTNDKLLL